MHAGSCGRTDIQFLECHLRTFETILLDHFELPPSLCATSCDGNPDCTVFVSTKDQQHCELYKWNDVTKPGDSAMLKLPF